MNSPSKPAGTSGSDSTGSGSEDDETLPNAKSSGNEGARGSRGQANSGAQEGNSTQRGGNERAPEAGSPDLRDADAQGGGGIASESTRSH